MDYVALGKSNLMVSRVGFGAMSLKDIGTEEDAAVLVHKAYDAGVNIFDISHSAKESERRLGECLHGIRHNVIIATKSCVLDPKELAYDLEESLEALQTDYIDLFQLEDDERATLNFGEVSKAMKKLKDKGKIRHFGFATEIAERAIEAVESSIFETIQLPFNIITADANLKVVETCQKTDTGFLAMRPLYGGLVQNIPLALGFYQKYESVVPLWGVRTAEELQQILYFNEHQPVIDGQFEAEVKRLRELFS